MAKVGANGSLDTTTATSPVNAIMMTNAGLVGDVSLSGAKVSLTQKFESAMAACVLRGLGQL
ncbi:hypothetical protein [Paraburkholderia kirstenboschensis]